MPTGTGAGVPTGSGPARAGTLPQPRRGWRSGSGGSGAEQVGLILPRWGDPSDVRRLSPGCSLRTLGYDSQGVQAPRGAQAGRSLRHPGAADLSLSLQGLQEGDESWEPSLVAGPIRASERHEQDRRLRAGQCESEAGVVFLALRERRCSRESSMAKEKAKKEVNRSEFIEIEDQLFDAIVESPYRAVIKNGNIYIPDPNGLPGEIIVVDPAESEDLDDPRVLNLDED